ncbi:hypothetical protein L1887_25359 [Cichorium endivia]|nr:hypothetical protein L1887_25359 [Cichorium endivia]
MTSQSQPGYPHRCHVTTTCRRLNECSCPSPELATPPEHSPLFRLNIQRRTTSISAAMYARFIGFAINKNLQQSRVRVYVYPFNYFSSLPAHPNHKDSNLVDDIRPTGSGSETGADDRVNVVRSSTTPSSSRENDGHATSYVAETARQGVGKALETGLEIGEMAKKTLDNVWDLTKDTTNMVKEAVTSDPKEKNDVPPTDQFVDDLRKRAGGYDLKKKG